MSRKRYTYVGGKLCSLLCMDLDSCDNEVRLCIDLLEHVVQANNVSTLANIHEQQVHAACTGKQDFVAALCASAESCKQTRPQIKEYIVYLLASAFHRSMTLITAEVVAVATSSVTTCSGCTY